MMTSAVSAAARPALSSTLLSAALTNTDWSNSGLIRHARSGTTCSMSFERRAHAVDDGERRDAAGLADQHQRARRAVDRDGIGLHLEAVVDMGDVAHEDRAAVDLLDRETR